MGCHLLTFAQQKTKSSDVRVTGKKKRGKKRQKKQHQEKSLGMIWSYSSCWIFTKRKMCTPQQETMVTNRGNTTRGILLVLWGCHSKWHILWSNKKQLLQIPKKREINGIELAMPPKNVSKKLQPQQAEQMRPQRLGSESQTEKKDLFPSGNDDADVSEIPTVLCSST